MTLTEITELLHPYGLDVVEDSGCYFVYRGEDHVFNASPSYTARMVTSLLGAVRARKLAPAADDATRNNLVRAELKQRDRRFSGEPITAFGALA